MSGDTQHTYWDAPALVKDRLDDHARRTAEAAVTAKREAAGRLAASMARDLAVKYPAIYQHERDLAAVLAQFVERCA